MAEDFLKFPRTPHLVWLGDTPPRGDKVLDLAEARTLLGRPASIEEKVDGANLGLSVGTDGRLRAQSRGHYLEPGTRGQFRPLWRWLALRQEGLVGGLGRHLVGFGEWCYARHTIPYDALPDWFLLFDVYDRQEGRFWSRGRRDSFARDAGLAVVPQLASGIFDQKRLTKLLGASHLGSASAEGLYLRWDDGSWLAARAKVVRPGWVAAGNEHWSSRPLQTNRLRASAEPVETEASRV